MRTLTITLNRKPAAVTSCDGPLCLMDDDTLEIPHAYHIPPLGGKPA